MLIYEAALQQGPIELLGLLLATALGLLALVRMAHQYLLGPSEDAPVIEPALLGETELDRPAPRRLKPEPRSTAVLTLLLLVTCLAIGCYPQPLLDVIGEATRGLAFVRIL
jgi:formate hydrogenlyase subunit 3/multisubunit Na+/H+ antiporter MnhD subunit